MPGLLKQTLSPRIYRLLLTNYQEFSSGFIQKSYSQEGEDMILRRIFQNQRNGFYVDVGAHHPKRFSNTYHFYQNGWKGINIDCNPHSMMLFRMRRPKDVNLELAISDKFEKLTYHAFDESAINTFEPNLQGGVTCGYTLLKKTEMESVTLDYVLSRYLRENQAIDFLSIDVEGMDLKVLKSNNWNRYRPKIVLVEEINTVDEFNTGSRIIDFMNSIEYVLYAKTVNTLIFRERFFRP
jgi:FkbM family methyltransferase